jgi:PAS domain S-box-containing protein
MRNSIRTRLAVTFIVLATSLLLLVGAVLAWQSYVTEQEQAIAAQKERAQRISIQVISYMQIQENALSELIAVRGLSDLDHNQQSKLLSELISFSDAFEKLALVDGRGREKIAISSTQINNQLLDRSNADEFTVPASNNRVYYGPVLFSESTGEPYMNVSVPITNVQTGKVTEVLVAEVRLKPIWDLLASSVTAGGQGSSTYIVDGQDRIVAHNNPSIVLRNTFFPVPEQDGVHTGVNGTSVVLTTEKIELGDEEFTVVTEIPTVEAFAPIIRTESLIAVLLVVAIVVAGGLGWLAARQIVQPIESLVKSAQAISSGDLSKQVEVTGRDELGLLGTTFNNMAKQLKEVFNTLEQRVADRTKALETSAEVSRRLTSILDPNVLATTVVDQVQTAFNYYYAQIYLFDDAGENLVLTAGTGEAGAEMMRRGHSLPKGRGLVGRAAETKKPVLVSDTAHAPDWLPNQLLPDTKAEAAIPIIIGDKVLGVLDVQDNVTNDITSADITLLESLASQVAISLQNARQYLESTRFRLGIENSGDAVFATDVNGTITYANATFEKVYGYSPAEAIGKNPRIIKSGLLNQENYQHFWGALLAKQSVTGEIVNKHRDGHLVYIAGTNSAIINEAGEIVGFLAVHHDITEQKKNQDLIEQRARQQGAINTITQRIQSATTIEDALQITARELGNALGKRQTLVELEPSILGGETKSVGKAIE